MTDQQSDAVDQEADLGVQPMLPGSLTLLDGAAAGVCSGGFCHLPTTKKR